jgi:hypothetical protein
MIGESATQELGLAKESLADEADTFGQSHAQHIIRCAGQLDAIHVKVAETVAEKAADRKGRNSAALVSMVEQVSNGRLAVPRLDLVEAEGAAQDSVREQIPIQHLGTRLPVGGLGKVGAGFLDRVQFRDGREIAAEVVGVAPDQIGEGLGVVQRGGPRL